MFRHKALWVAIIIKMVNVKKRDTFYHKFNVILTGGFEKDSCKVWVKSVNNLSRHYYSSNKWSFVTQRLSSSITGNAWAHKVMFQPLRLAV